MRISLKHLAKPVAVFFLILWGVIVALVIGAILVAVLPKQLVWVAELSSLGQVLWTVSAIIVLAFVVFGGYLGFNWLEPLDWGRWGSTKLAVVVAAATLAGLLLGCWVTWIIYGVLYCLIFLTLGYGGVVLLGSALIYWGYYLSNQGHQPYWQVVILSLTGGVLVFFGALPLLLGVAVVALVLYLLAGAK